MLTYNLAKNKNRCFDKIHFTIKDAQLVIDTDSGQIEKYKKPFFTRWTKIMENIDKGVIKWDDTKRIMIIAIYKSASYGLLLCFNAYTANNVKIAINITKSILHFILNLCFRPKFQSLSTSLLL